MKSRPMLTTRQRNTAGERPSSTAKAFAADSLPPPTAPDPPGRAASVGAR